MTAEDWRVLTPYIYHHVNPYGRIELDMGTRLTLAALSLKNPRFGETRVGAWECLG
jgi:hypothetical protein